MKHTATIKHNSVTGAPVVTVESDHHSALYIENDARAAYHKAYAECRLFERYHADISSWDWIGIKSDCADNPRESYSDNEPTFGYCYLGSCFALTPSGKYYLPYACSNVEEYEALQDEMWYSALDAIAESYGLWIESGEGDPCDIFAVCAIEDTAISDES